MPGRGQYWKVGGINDLHIVEADLDSALQAKVNAGGGYSTVEDEGSPLTQRVELNFVGAGVTASDDGEKTVVTIPGGGGGGGFPDPNTTFEFYDEFIYNTFINENWEQLSGIGTWDVTISSIGGVVARGTQGEGASGGGGLRLNQNSLCNVDNDFTLRWRTRSLNNTLLAVRLGLLTENFSTNFGTFPFGTEPTPYIWFGHDGSGNWFAETHDGSTQNSTDTGVAITTTFKTFEINKSGSTITFLIDNSQVAQFTTNLPSGNLQMFYFAQDGESVSKSQEFDTAQLQNTR